MEYDPNEPAEQLRSAAQGGDLARVRELLDGTIDINAFDEIGMTALHYAVEAKHIAIVKVLLEQGADVNARHEPTNSNTVLSDAAETCSLEMARLLVQAGADPTIRGWMGLNALDRARGRKRDDGPEVYQLLTQSTPSRPKTLPRIRQRRHE